MLTLSHLLLCLSAVSISVEAATIATISNKVIFTPPSNYTDPRVLYPRTEELSDGTLLATWENYSPEPPLVYIPINEYKTSGASWMMFSLLFVFVFCWGLRYKPILKELPEELCE